MGMKPSDVFRNTDDRFKERVLEGAQQNTYYAGHRLFSEGDPATDLYLLINGRVKLSISDEDQTVYVVSRHGECFGWSCLLDRQFYSATAECLEDSDLILIRKDHFEAIIHEDPVNGVAFYKSLASLVGTRLLYNYLSSTCF